MARFVLFVLCLVMSFCSTHAGEPNAESQINALLNKVSQLEAILTETKSKVEQMEQERRKKTFVCILLFAVIRAVEYLSNTSLHVYCTLDCAKIRTFCLRTDSF